MKKKKAPTQSKKDKLIQQVMLQMKCSREKAIKLLKSASNAVIKNAKFQK